MRTFILCLSIVAALAGTAVAQDTTDAKKKKSTADAEWMDLDLSERTPAISLFYGGATSSRESIAGTFEPNMVFGGTLGMERQKVWSRDPSIVVRHASMAYLWYGGAADAQGVTTPMQGDEPALATSTAANYYRFGFTDETGFGYKLGEKSNVTFIVAPSVLSWAVVQPQAVLASDTASAQGLRDFEGNLRFGESMHPAIAWRVAEPISLRVGYQWSQIYPRHLFWFWFLSQGIEGIADAGATWFAREIGKSSPAAMPIVYFLLRNGVAAGFKALRMNQMNWPFTTEAPLNVQMWTVGFDVHF
jgi:hypothetical protein